MGERIRRTRHAHQIRSGIERARLVRRLLDGINLDPTTDAAIHLASAVARMTRAETPALERRAYLRTRLRERRTAPTTEQENRP